MTRQTATNDATRDTTKRDTLTPKEAARRLGVSVRTVQRRAKNGELNSIERDGKRFICFTPDATQARQAATNDATRDTTKRDNDATQRQIDATQRQIDATQRQIDATQSDTAQVGSTPDLAAQLAQSREEVLFLRAMLEARERDAAELRAALRKALDAMPKALASGSTPDAETTARENATQAPKAAPSAPTHAAPKASAQRPKLTAWQRAAARILGIR